MCWDWKLCQILCTSLRSENQQSRQSMKVVPLVTTVTNEDEEMSHKNTNTNTNDEEVSEQKTEQKHTINRSHSLTKRLIIHSPLQLRDDDEVSTSSSMPLTQSRHKNTASGSKGYEYLEDMDLIEEQANNNKQWNKLATIITNYFRIIIAIVFPVCMVTFKAFEII